MLSTEQFAAFVATSQLLENYVLTWEREPKNAIGTYCSSKDRWFIGH